MPTDWRLSINTGRYIGEELTLDLCVDHVLSQRHKSGFPNGDVVVNGSTSRVTADIAEKQGCQFHRSYVGEAKCCCQNERGLCNHRR